MKRFTATVLGQVLHTAALSRRCRTHLPHSTTARLTNKKMEFNKIYDFNLTNK